MNRRSFLEWREHTSATHWTTRWTKNMDRKLEFDDNSLDTLSKFILKIYNINSNILKTNQMVGTYVSPLLDKQLDQNIERQLELDDNRLITHSELILKTCGINSNILLAYWLCTDPETWCDKSYIKVQPTKGLCLNVIGVFQPTKNMTVQNPRSSQNFLCPN